MLYFIEGKIAERGRQWGEQTAYFAEKLYQEQTYYSMLDYVLDAASGVPDKQRIYLELGFEEATTNIISYAYGENVGEVSNRTCLEDEHFFIELKDSGVPFNPLTMSEAEKPMDLESAKVGGLGIS